LTDNDVQLSFSSLQPLSPLTQSYQQFHEAPLGLRSVPAGHALNHASRERYSVFEQQEQQRPKHPDDAWPQEHVLYLSGVEIDNLAS